MTDLVRLFSNVHGPEQATAPVVVWLRRRHSPFGSDRNQGTSLIFVEKQENVRMKILRRMLSAAVMLTLVPEASADSAELVRRAFSPPASGQAYVYEFIDASNGDDPTTTRGRIDASKPKGQRVTILEATGKNVDLKKIDKRYEQRSGERDIWCDKLIGGADGPITEVGREGAMLRLAFRPLAAPSAGNDEKELYKNLSAVVSIDEASGQVKSFYARLNKPWNPMPLAKLEVFEMKSECAVAANGRSYSASMELKIVGSAIGASFARTITQTIVRITPAD